MRALVIASLLASGCTVWFRTGDEFPDAGVLPDAGVYPDASPGPCGAGDVFAGQIVDIDATPTMPRGIPGAVLTERASTATAMTDATGAFQLCPQSQFYDIDMPPPYADAIAAHDYFAIDNGALYSPTSFRAWTPARAATFYSEHGLVYDASKAHVMVFTAGDAVDVSLARPHGTMHAAQEGYMTPVELEWSPGTAGRYLWIPNVDASQPTGRFSSGSSDIDIPLVAGTTTFVVYSVILL